MADMTTSMMKSATSATGLTRKRRIGETIIQASLFLCGAISILTTVGIVYELGKEAMLFFSSPDVSLLEFFSSTHWQPAIGEFGIWPLVLGTVITSVLAMLVALPLGLGSAIYLSEYASERARNILKPTLEILAGIPTVVYGYFALTFMTPLLRRIFGEGVVQIFNSASAGIVVGILIIPLVASLSEDALHAVPRSLREAAYGLGATRLETSLKVVVPAALSGIAAAFVVAISRAIGETMGRRHRRRSRPQKLHPGQRWPLQLRLQSLPGRGNNDGPHRTHQRRRPQLRLH